MRIATAVSATLLLACAGAAAADDLSDLRERLEAQEQKIRVLERKLELQDEAAKAAVPNTPIVRASPQQGFRIQSADAANQIRLRGVLQFDGRYFPDDVTPETADTWILRRVRPILEGTLNGVYDFRFTPDFAQGKTVIQDAYVTARFQPWAAVTVGKFKQQVGLERLEGDADTRFPERGFPTSLVPNRDLGVQLGGDIAGGAINYSVAYTNGVTDGGSSDGNATPDVENDAKGDVNARVFFQPFLNSDHFALRGLGFGIGGTYVESTGSGTNTLLPSYRTPGQATFFSYRSNTATTGNNATFADGERLRYSPQFYYYYGSYGLLGEYAVVSQEVTRANGAVLRSDKLDNKAWQLQFSWLLTGEDETYRSPTPGTNFQPGKPGYGAWELVARIHQLAIDSDAFTGGANSFANPATAARKATAAGLGLNWYLTQNVKWFFGYEQTRFEGGAATGDRPDEKTYLTRVGLQF